MTESLGESGFHRGPGRRRDRNRPRMAPTQMQKEMGKKAALEAAASMSRDASPRKVLGDYLTTQLSLGELRTDDLDTFLRPLPLTTLTHEERDSLGGPLTVEEVQDAISHLSSGKTPGTDSLPMDFYKKYTTLLAPKLVEMYTEALHRGLLPDSLREALMVPLPKLKSR
ncbi:hypothetical protein NDU88_002720 [Pleurodeles waltl]|uniref:Uncharacterized protein n=1 Tax=Pleurodeles waltl TaxID=8319 RepID=A0AAV7T389_PLEWA|nr:hypothetical protein NDU88_002720 [Pleurodeles waltl]